MASDVFLLGTEVYVEIAYFANAQALAFCGGLLGIERGELPFAIALEFA
jgi:hypothetical protein